MLPEHMKAELDKYKNGDHPYEFGGFMTAILANDLVGAASRADGQNRNLLFEYASYLYNDLPRGMWGSYKIVEQNILAQRMAKEASNA